MNLYLIRLRPRQSEFFNRCIFSDWLIEFFQIVKAQNVFFLISLLNVVRVSCTIFVPLQFIFTTEAMVSIQRITDFLIQEESEFIGKNTNVEKGTG